MSPAIEADGGYCCHPVCPSIQIQNMESGIRNAEEEEEMNMWHNSDTLAMIIPQLLHNNEIWP